MFSTVFHSLLCRDDGDASGTVPALLTHSTMGAAESVLDLDLELELWHVMLFGHACLCVSWSDGGGQYQDIPHRTMRTSSASVCPCGDTVAHVDRYTYMESAPTTIRDHAGGLE